ncbi:ImmA/IrrE family metallo-endopeptidase [Halobacteria archaeon HArc-gm2]|nr:ImmA/IrrE family metallo-endopeptidase [Halobacteria archaeon HArc-gm2]
MSSQAAQRVSFDDKETRDDEMHSTITEWVEDLADLTDEAAASEQFQAWLDVQSRFHDYSYRNSLLIKAQCPEATKVAGYHTWQSEFDRHVKEGESAIWIWAPIVTTRCPECENAPSYHKQIECEYDETPPEEWSEGLVGFRPTTVFDISQTEGDPLPELDTEATGDAGDLVSTLLEAATELGIDVRLVPKHEWSHGDAKGVCQYDGDGGAPVVEVLEVQNDADLATTLVHECAHALLHGDIDDATERSKREVEAEAIAYVVGRHFDLDTSNSAFYLAAWDGDDSDAITDRLGRISRTAGRIIDEVGEQ